MPDRFVAGLAARLRPRGLDIVFAFAIDDRLNALFPFPRFGRASCLGVLIGNSRALWTPFLDWRGTRADLDDPLDAYVEQCIVQAVGPQKSAVFFTQRRDYRVGDGTAAVPFQRLGREIGFAALGPAHLSVHPDFGPWFAFRAAVAVDLPFPPGEPSAGQPRVEPCATCSQPCLAALQVAMDATSGRPERADIRGNWERWIAVRDACPEGRAHRYSEAQTMYHYTKDARHLG